MMDYEIESRVYNSMILDLEQELLNLGVSVETICGIKVGYYEKHGLLSDRPVDVFRCLECLTDYIVHLEEKKYVLQKEVDSP
jgi:hypothetical protein